MSIRLDKFRDYSQHAWLHKLYHKLTWEEPFANCALTSSKKTTISALATLSSRSIRMFLYNTQKPKHWKLILELLTCANSATVASKKSK